MGRKKIKPEKKKIHFGISIHPELGEMLKEQSEKENKSISKFIEDVMKKHLKKDDDMNEKY